MLPLRHCATVCVILLFGCALARARQSKEEISSPDRAFVATKIYSMLDGSFAHRQGIPDFDLDAAYKSYLAVMPFKLNGRAEIVGEATEGSSGQPYFVDFGNGMSFMAGAARHTFPDNSPFESVGISPTVPVDLHVEDVKNEIDVVLTKAQKIAEHP
jgi:hypothetical protein